MQEEAGQGPRGGRGGSSGASGADAGRAPAREMRRPGLQSLFDKAERSPRLWHNYRFMEKHIIKHTEQKDYDGKEKWYLHI